VPGFGFGGDGLALLEATALLAYFVADAVGVGPVLAVTHATGNEGQQQNQRENRHDGNDDQDHGVGSHYGLLRSLVRHLH
jgi:hypothetical protein